ncbi:hypothetical protein FOCC_FOCC013135 [Frankliniella occidentalis]|nr:hypothetical protein FOCC_FOCC013135 [Frankliniella occidentalis]
MDWLVRFFGLSCVPCDEVGDAFQEIYDSKPADCEEEFDKFVDYVLDTYTETTKFPLSMWTWLPDELPSTTNGAESFHADFNRQFAGAHPNIHASIQVLLEIQAQTCVKMQSVEVGESNRSKASVCERVGRKLQAWGEVWASAHWKEERE